MKHDSVVEHHGVLGMRWGVRRKKNPDGTFRSAEHVQSRALMAKGVRNLSNKEIASLNARLNLERELHRLNPSAQKEGRKFVDDLVKKSGEKLSGALASMVVQLAVQQVKKRLPKS